MAQCLTITGGLSSCTQNSGTYGLKTNSKEVCILKPAVHKSIKEEDRVSQHWPGSVTIKDLPALNSAYNSCPWRSELLFQSQISRNFVCLSWQSKTCTHGQVLMNCLLDSPCSVVLVQILSSPCVQPEVMCLSGLLVSVACFQLRNR